MRDIILTLLSAVFMGAVPLAAQAEPDGSRDVGTVQPIHAKPAAPSWLRATSHAAACVDTRHYLYEAYAKADAGNSLWIVRYVMLPEGSEAFREIEQVFLFDSNPNHKPQALKPSEITFDPKLATWKNTYFTLVDRRDLMLP